jgi:hypothetical protein
MILYVVMVTCRGSGHGDDTFPVMVTAEFDRALKASRTVESRIDVHRFASPDHCSWITRLEDGKFHAPRPNQDSDRLIFVRRATLFNATFRRWNERWFDDELRKEHETQNPRR